MNSDTEKNERKKKGGFVGPSDMDMSKGPDNPPPEMGKDTENPPPGSKAKKKPKWLWIAIIGVITVALVIASIMLFSAPSKGSGEPEISYYEANGFSVRKVQSRMLNRSFFSEFKKGKQEYYDTVFNIQEDNHEFDLFAPIVDLQALRLSDLKKSELVIAIFFSQNSETNETISRKVIIKGLSSGIIEKTGEYVSLPAAGIIYLGMDDLTEDISVWSPGEYHILLYFEDMLVKDIAFNVTN